MSDIYFRRNVSGIFDAKNVYRPQKIRVYGRPGGGYYRFLIIGLYSKSLKDLVQELIENGVASQTHSVVSENGRKDNKKLYHMIKGDREK